MAYEEPLVDGEKERSDEDDQGRRVDFRGGTVIADSIDDAYAALSSIGIVVGSDSAAVYPGGTVASRHVNRIKHSNIFDWEAGFSAAITGDTTPPEQRPQFVEWDEGKETYPTSRDVYGEPILNSALDLMDDNTEDVDTVLFTVYRWEAEYSVRKRIDYRQTCNSDTVTFLGEQYFPGELALRSYKPTGRIEHSPEGEQVPTQIEVAYRFEARGPLRDSAGEDILDGDIRTGFYERKLDAGKNGWSTKSGNEFKGRIQTKGGTPGEYAPIASPVPLHHGIPITDEDSEYFIGGTAITNWVTQTPAESVVYDESNENASYILIPKLLPVAYTNIFN